MNEKKITKAQYEAIISDHIKRWPDRPPDEESIETIIELRNTGKICQDTFEWLFGGDPFLEDDEIEVAKLKAKERRRYWAIRAKTGGMPKRATTRRKKAKKDEV